MCSRSRKYTRCEASPAKLLSLCRFFPNSFKSVLDDEKEAKAAGNTFARVVVVLDVFKRKEQRTDITDGGDGAIFSQNVSRESLLREKAVNCFCASFPESACVFHTNS